MKRTTTEEHRARSAQRRAQLEALSERLRPMKPQGVRLNTLIVAHYQMETGQSDFRSFKAWKDEGFAVRKGETGFAVWGEPREINKPDAEASAPQPGEMSTRKPRQWFPVAYLFHAGQVDPIDGQAKPAPTQAPVAADIEQALDDIFAGLEV